MGLVVKPYKCRSLTIQSRTVTNVSFQLKDQVTGATMHIASVLEKPLKFLGSQVTSDNSPNAMFVAIHSKLKQNKHSERYL